MGWIGIDLDGTLAFYDHWRGSDHIGPPVPLMLNRVRQMIMDGKDVRIFTARVTDPDPLALWTIENWCRYHLGVTLPVTNVKDFQMEELWDDRAIRVQKNTGEII
jgi:hypothetical protein